MALGMMCFGKKSSPKDDTLRRHEMIEKQLKIDKKMAEREVKILLLGMYEDQAGCHGNA